MKEHICDFCGRASNKKIKCDGHIFCHKHYRQYKKYGKVLDNNPRTVNDRNEYHIYGDITYIDLYNKNCEKVAQAIIDTEDLNKVKYTKWRLSGGYAKNNSKKCKPKHMSREILGLEDPNLFVDHINHNTLDNRKCNLRPVTRSQNQMNGTFKGVDYRNGKYHARIKIDQKAINLGTYMYPEEAYLARWFAENMLFGEYAYSKPKPELNNPLREYDIKAYVYEKVQRL